MSRTTQIFVTAAALAAVLAFSIPAALGKGGGNGQGSGGGHSSYTGTLVASPSVLHAGDRFDVTGCGYDTSLGSVVVGFVGGGSGTVLDADGCFTITSVTALSGDTLAPGTYPVTAYQYVHGKLTETGETTVTVVS